MEFCASNISIKNITFEQEGNDSEGIVVVKNGRVTFDDCDMRCETNGVSVESNGELVMRQCKVHGAKVSWIRSNIYSHLQRYQAAWKMGALEVWGPPL